MSALPWALQEHRMSPFAGLAFNPFDGIIQVRHMSLNGQGSPIAMGVVAGLPGLPAACAEVKGMVLLYSAYMLGSSA